MTATITIPDGFIATMVPAAVLKLMPNGVQPFLFRPMTNDLGDDHFILTLARVANATTYHVSVHIHMADFAMPAILYERFILPASEALRRRAEKVR